MSTLYIHMPSKAAAEAAEQWTALPCSFALTSNAGALEHEGVEPLARLAEPIVRAQRVVMLLAASDVSLLRIKVPPMSPSRLKAALPNMVEDQLITDPAECVVVAGPLAEGLRTVAVVQRAWLDVLARAVLGLGARHVSALPSQLCLPHQPGTVSAAVAERGDSVDVILRLSEHDGMGLPIMPESVDTAAREAIEAIAAIVPQGPVTLYVPQPAVAVYQAAADVAVPEGEGRRIAVFADNWRHWITGASHASPDLMTGLSAAAGPKTDWRRWRWPVTLAGLLLLVNVAALNIDWWRMKNEADGLRAGMMQTYRKAFPKDPVVVDPLAQMRQKIAAVKRDSGQAAPDDFTALAAAFGEAWASVGQGQGSTARKDKAALPGIAALEYRDRSLFVRFKAEGQPPIDQVKSALAGRDLSVVAAPPQSGATVWQIRSGK